MPDFSPWGATAMGGLGAWNTPSPQPISGASANTLPFAQNQGMPAPPLQGGMGAPSMGAIPRPWGDTRIGNMNPQIVMGGPFGAPSGVMNPWSYGGNTNTRIGNMNPQIGMGPFGAPVSGGGGFIGGGGSNPLIGNGGLPFGTPVNPGGQSPFGGQSQMRNPMMSLLLPMILQRMGMVNRPGGIGGMIPQNQISGLFGPMPPPTGGTPQRSLMTDRSGTPKVQTASPFDMIGGNAVPQNFGPAMNAFLPPSMGGQAPGIPPATPAPPPQQILQTDRTGIPKMDPAAAMAQQAQQAQIANTLTNMSNMGPQQNMMAQLLMQQMPFMYR